MSNVVLRNVSVRGLVMSVALMLCGIAIAIFGARELILFNTEPVSYEQLQDSFADDTRVRLTSYRVAGVFDMSGYSYFVLEYSEGNYCLIETTKDGYYYNRLNAQGKHSISQQDLVIEGYLHHLKDQQPEGVREALTGYGMDPSQAERVGGYAVKILVKDYSLIVAGSFIAVMSVAVFVLSRWLFIRQRKYA